MAVGDIKAVAIRADGWSADVTIEGWDGNQGSVSYNFDPDGTPRMVFTVVSEGYNATGVLGTITRTIIGTKAVRLPKPNENATDETTSGADMVVRVALSANVYNDDRNGGAGTSGVNPTVTVAAGWATSGGPIPGSTTAATNLAVTNNSTLDYPVAFGQHDPIAGVLMRARVKANFPVAFNARHGEGIACVRWNATGGTSAHTQEVFATTQTQTQRTGSGLFACAFGGTIPLAGFTQAEIITVRVRAYPLVGDENSILDTNGRSLPENECLGWNDLVVTCDKDNLLDSIAYVTPTGNDATGAGTIGSPWRTPDRAMTTAGINIVRLHANGTYQVGNNTTRRAVTENIVIEPSAGVSASVEFGRRSTIAGTYTSGTFLDGETLTQTGTGATAIKFGNQTTGGGTLRVELVTGTPNTSGTWVGGTSGAVYTPSALPLAMRSTRVGRMLFRGVTILAANANSWPDGEDADNFMIYSGCTFSNPTPVVLTGPPTYRYDCTYFLNCTGDLNRTRWILTNVGTTRAAAVFDGCAFFADSTSSTYIDGWYRVVACSGTNQVFQANTSTNTAPTQAGILFEFNTQLDNAHASRTVFLWVQALTGLSLIGNVLEKTAGSSPQVQLWADSTAAACNHVIFAHNTLVGSGSGRRCNLFYNDSGTTPYVHRSVFMVANHIDEGNIKSDAFGHTAVSITRSGSTATLTCATEDGSARYAVGQSVFISGASQPEYNGTFTVASNSGATTGGTITFTVSGTPATPATGAITYFGLGRTGNWEQLYGTNTRNNNVDTLSSASFDWENLGENATRDTPTFVDSANNDYMPAVGSTLLNRVRPRFYAPFDLYGRRLNDVSPFSAVGGVQRDIPVVVAPPDPRLIEGASLVTSIGPNTGDSPAIAPRYAISGKRHPMFVSQTVNDSSQFQVFGRIRSFEFPVDIVRSGIVNASISVPSAQEYFVRRLTSSADPNQLASIWLVNQEPT